MRLAAKRRRTAASAETAVDQPRAQKIAEMEAAVARRGCQIAELTADNASGDAREAAHHGRIAGLEANTARLSIEAAALRWAAAAAEPAAALRQLVRALGVREQDPRDRVFLEQSHAATQTHRDWKVDFRPVHVLARDHAAAQPQRDWSETSVFRECSSLSEITLPPNLTEIGKLTLGRCTSLREITLPPNPRREWRSRILPRPCVRSRCNLGA